MKQREIRTLKVGNHYATEDREGMEDRAPNGRYYEWWICLLGEQGSNEVMEELDVYGTSKEAARQLANEIIKTDYIDGMRIVKMVFA